MRYVPSDGQGGLLAEGHSTIGVEHTIIPAWRMVSYIESTLGVNNMRTLDDLAHANLGLEVATADGGVEPST